MHDYWILRAIALCGSQKELARRMGIKPRKISYLLNQAKKINLEDALRIEVATDGVVTCFHLIGRINIKVKRILEKKLKTVNELLISERVSIAMAYEKKLGHRNGTRIDLQACENFPKVKGRTEELAAKEGDFGNYKTYRQAKKVVQYGSWDLIQAMDSKHISISVAAKLIQIPEKARCKILQLNKKEIITYIKKHESKKPFVKHLTKSVLDKIFLDFSHIYLQLANSIEE